RFLALTPAANPLCFQIVSTLLSLLLLALFFLPLAVSFCFLGLLPLPLKPFGFLLRLFDALAGLATASALAPHTKVVFPGVTGIHALRTNRSSVLTRHLPLLKSVEC